MWSALIRKWNTARSTYDTLVLRVEETDQPGWLVGLYDGEHAIAEILAENPQSAVEEAVKAAQTHFDDPSITRESLVWVQI